jgi:dolichyl-diphosphooligosaccharide--protein glycosyltransferase
MMRASFLYSLHSNGLEPGVVADPSKFKEVYKSKYGKVRIYEILGVDQESKKWVADPKNRICDVPGSWFCRGQYPPALTDVLSKKRDFAQLEDFNRKTTRDEDYQKQYFEHLNNPELATMKALNNIEGTVQQTKPTQEEIDTTYARWEDTEYTTLLWSIITRGEIQELKELIEKVPLAAFVRSSDGRGPMWWAFESRKQEIVKMLIGYGLSYEDKDKYGMTPVDLLGASSSGDVPPYQMFPNSMQVEREL